MQIVIKNGYRCLYLTSDGDAVNRRMVWSLVRRTRWCALMQFSQRSSLLQSRQRPFAGLRSSQDEHNGRTSCKRRLARLRQPAKSSLLHWGHWKGPLSARHFAQTVCEQGRTFGRPPRLLSKHEEHVRKLVPTRSDRNGGSRSTCSGNDILRCYNIFFIWTHKQIEKGETKHVFYISTRFRDGYFVRDVRNKKKWFVVPSYDFGEVLRGDNGESPD